ncbi:DUF1648 domain-containing protein [Bradyrhizobium sp. LHD-71]|uniref:DUF1648 domain-containing protein n=1 Tax=Bradyrhizobium sp. LHD-71 TaxID=3072141 RepID=UPI0028107C87|nr:hypothetical protein [Bradyrhizobium sp. LHD-71]MDQ8729445.1 hypothetical protein [Bradyrhizobium sp. LHD-71]
MLAADLVFWPAVAFVAACSLHYAPRIRSERIAMQWGLDGKPTWYAPKSIGLWGTVVLMLAVRLAIWAATIYVPERVDSPEIGLPLFAIIIAAAHFWILRSAARAR